MSPETAIDAVNFAVRLYPSIEHISFFGGEPTLNPEVIRMVCAYVTYLHDRGVIARLPSFGLTTSGYRASEEVTRLIVDYDLSVTVSVDGPPSIHNALRVTKGNKATFDRVAQTIDRLSDAMSRPPEIECTYTGEHIRQGIDVVDLLDFFNSRFGAKVLHCPMVVVPPTSSMHVPLTEASRIYPAAIRYSVANLCDGVEKTLSSVRRMLSALSGSYSIQVYCPAGTQTLAVNADGNIYPCPMLVGGTSQRLGSVHDPAAGIRPPNELAALLNGSAKPHNAACQSCWAEPMCFGCLGEDLARGCPPSARSAIPGESPWCDFHRLVVESFIASLDAHVRRHDSA